jgi:hypothetical protein
MKRIPFLGCLIALLLLSGCASHKIDWSARVGIYTFDQAVTEIGPPDKQAKLTDGSVVAEWLTRRGYQSAYVGPAYYPYGPWGYGPYYGGYVTSYSPDYFLRLTFDPEGKLTAWKKFAR